MTLEDEDLSDIMSISASLFKINLVLVLNGLRSTKYKWRIPSLVAKTC